MNKKENIIVAIDNMTKAQAESFLDQNKEHIYIIKVGLELFCKYGRAYIEELTEKYNLEIFLDLKLHDIPSTVAKSIRSLEGLKVKFLTIHLSGGQSMIKDALESRDKYLPNTKILGVSVLTSLDDNDTNKIWATNGQEAFKRLFKIAQETNIDGVVSSAYELSLIESGKEILNVCPGIRIGNDDKGDQKRVMTPKDAFNAGADYLVIGRSITNNPEILKDIENYL
jgi:orotidine-5'-phosphate decarboxylase